MGSFGGVLYGLRRCGEGARGRFGEFGAGIVRFGGRWSVVIAKFGEESGFALLSADAALGGVRSSAAYRAEDRDAQKVEFAKFG